MARALKVYRTAAGFHDAYVAASSQKAALEAWGSDHDLFARGIAELVTDPALTAEPLASPGTVIKRSRGSAAEQIASLPARKPRAAAVETAEPASAEKPVKPKPKPKPPKPDRSAVEAAEEALEALRRDHDKAQRALAKREADLARERRAVERKQDAALRETQAEVDAARDAYDAKLRAWRAAR
ncbi:hypothetical protein FSB78_08130 [Sphingomonas ginsenosidivorax]|uniref:Cell envelope biogenesis protein TolA n=1 Tax=Sphingomonas ginsenosidivorax TaxID=862135 RepID=A0A5C6UDN7_9SPHN|nr:hypothetical protein [Sphingomonas ginsenosidivorax]TXC70917.1 hypothetical protein FSB78_08130 [Sphingomonas ginsenosidivorax]